MSKEHHDIVGDHENPPLTISISLPDTRVRVPIGHHAQVDLCKLPSKKNRDLSAEKLLAGEFVWDPSRLESDKVDDFLGQTRKEWVGDGLEIGKCVGDRFISMEDALGVLKSSGYNVDCAQKMMRSRGLVWGEFLGVPDGWNEEDIELFEEGMRIHYKDFSAVQKFMMQYGSYRPVGEVVSVYYTWKKSSLYDKWKESLSLKISTDMIDSEDDQISDHDDHSVEDHSIEDHSISENTASFDEILSSSGKRKNEFTFPHIPQKKRRLTSSACIGLNADYLSNGPVNLSFSLDDSLYHILPPFEHKQEDVHNAPISWKCEPNIPEMPLGSALHYYDLCSENNVESWFS